MVSRAETFVVHIYRRTGNKIGMFAGVVEVVRDGMWYRFASFEDLRHIFEREAFPGAIGYHTAGKSYKSGIHRPSKVP